MIVVRLPTPTHFKARQFEWGMGLLLLVWAVNIAVVPAAFDQPTFGAIRSVASPLVWTVICCAIAALRLGALYINGTWRASPFIRAGTAALSGLFWTALALGLWASRLPNTGVPIYLGVASFDLYGAYQASKDARVAWDRSREAARADPRSA